MSVQAIALTNQRRVMRSLITREMTALLEPRGLGFVSAIIEPVVHLSILCLWHWCMRGRAIYGHSTVVYIACGLCPAYLFVNLSSRFTSSVKQGKVGRRFPFERTLDVLIATAVARFIVYNVAVVILFAGIYWIVDADEAIPRHWPTVITAVMYLTTIGFGMGLINAVIDSVFPYWHFVWGSLTRVLVLFSGIFYLPINLPLYMRDVMVWNPVFQGVELFRQGVYPHYPTLLFSESYAITCAEGLLVGGLMLEHIFRRRLGEVHFH